MIATVVDRIRVGVRSDFAKSSLMVFVALIAASALYYGYYLVVGHTLAVAAYGTVMSLVSVSMLATTPAAIAQTILAKVVAQRAEKKAQIPRGIALRTASVALIAAIVIVVAGCATRIPIAHYLHIERDEYVILTVVATALCVLLFLGRGLLQGAQLFRAFAVSNVLDGVLRFALAIALTGRFGIEGALGAMVLGLVVSVAYGTSVAAQFTLREPGPRLSTSIMLPNAVLATGLISFAMIALGYYDPILAKHYLAPNEAGVYGVLSLAGRTGAIILSFIPVVLLPRVTEQTIRGISSRMVLGVALAVSGVVCLSTTIGCAVLGPFVIGMLAGPAFRAAAPLLALYVAGASFLGLANVLAAYLIGKHDYRGVPLLLVAAGAEVAAVILRHSTIDAVVQDVVAGHAAVALVMLGATAVRIFQRDDRSRQKEAA